MIGQKRLLNYIKCCKDVFPRAVVIVGAPGSGKRTVCAEIARLIDAEFAIAEGGVDAVRALIDTAYNMTRRILLVVPDVDDLSTAAKNALLKVVEEPPHEVYIALLASDVSHLLATLRSRCVTLTMDPYTSAELEQYAQSVGVEFGPIRDWVKVPGDINALSTYNVEEFSSFVDLVLDNLAEVSTANALKISQRFALKNNDEGYDLKLFWRACESKLISRVATGARADVAQNVDALQTTSEYLSALRIKGINKQMLLDGWLLQLRRVLCREQNTQ